MPFCRNIAYLLPYCFDLFGYFVNLKFPLAYLWIGKKGVAFVIVLICWLKVLSGFTNREESFGSKITKLREEEREFKKGNKCDLF